ncbi:MAG: hypothetical protein HGB23_03395 [Chlorobiaceae bacterium]|nr:hypothetical protein [Chlorobiaceae bacterium]
MVTKPIGKVTLHQQGVFVAKLQFVYQDGSKMIHLDGSSGITIGCSVTLDPGAYGVPDNAMMSVYVFVVWGSDQQGHEIFNYVPGSPNVADYTITGTTLNNTLTYNK